MGDEGQKRGRGRPSKFNDLDLEQVRVLSELGATDAQMTAFFKVSVAAWNNWKTDNPNFMDTLKAGKLEADKKVEEALFKRALGYEAPDGTHIPPHPTSIFFWLQNRQPQKWRNQISHEVTGGLSVQQESAAFKQILERISGKSREKLKNLK